MIRVFVADDHAIVRRGVVSVLSEHQDLEVVGEAGDGRKVLTSPLVPTCHVLVLDLSLPRVEGIEVLRRMRELAPAVAIVVLSSHPEDQFRWRTLSQGASFYVSKERPPSVLVDAIRKAARGERETEVAPTPGGSAPPHTRLSAREHQVFRLVVEGRTVADVAAELDVQSCTVSNHLAKVREKLGLTSVAELVRYAYAHDLVHRPPGDGTA